MATPNLPAYFHIPFADSGAKNTIPEASASPLASLTDGFPAVTMQPISSGGVPPAGEDFNGILNWITQWLFYAGAGGRPKFDSTLSTSIGGYPKGMVLLADDEANEYISLEDNNTYNPNTPANIGTHWGPHAGAVAGNGHYAVDTGTTNAYVVSLSPPIVSNVKGTIVSFKATNTNTSSCTLNAGGGVTALRRTDGGSMVAGDIQNGAVYTAVFDSVAGYYYLLAPVASQYSPGTVSSILTGVIQEFAGIVLPSGFLWCDGSAVSRADYATLFSVIGTLYGEGDAVTTFNVPDRRGRVGMGVGNGLGLTPKTIAEMGGDETITLTVAQLPPHSHGVMEYAGIYGASTYNHIGAAVNGSSTSLTGQTGSGSSHDNIPPYLALNYIIKT